VRLEVPREPHLIPWFAKDLLNLDLLDINAQMQTLLWVKEWRAWAEATQMIGV
jgi:hypothetical protein